ncbi:MAG: DMT family transporter [Eggerthellaceae bacterium]|nr:DMT family transporter [Eggerthellaceae bacterium]
MASGAKPLWVYKAMILTATVIWGLSFVVMKDTVGVVEPGYLIGIRFLITGALVAALFWKNFRRALTPRALRTGVIFGVLLFAAYWTQTVGLVYTTPGKNAFLTAVYVVLVPFLCWPLQKQRPTVFRVVAACLCLAGIGCVSASGESFMLGFGDIMTLVCAVFFALHIVYVNRASAELDMMGMTAIQFLTMGVLGLAFGLFTEQPPALSALIAPDFLWNMLYLVVFSSAMGLVFQNIALAHLPAATASLLLSLESVFGVVFSVLLFGEPLTAMLLLGFAVIFAGIVVSEAGQPLWEKRRNRRHTAVPDELVLDSAEA